MSRTTTLKNKSPIGSLIVMRLKELGKNQKWLAENSSISQVHLCNILAGRANPAFKTLYRLAQNLEIDVKVLTDALLSQS